MDKENFTQLVLQMESTLFHVAFSILHQEADCCDAVQETILKAYAARNNLRNPGYFKTWITRILINECYGILRGRSRLVPMDAEAMDEQNIVGQENPEAYIKEEYLDLYRAIEKLKEKDKMCILLFYMEDYTLAQIADALDIPEGTVKSRLNRGRCKLRGILRDGTEDTAAMGS